MYAYEYVQKNELKPVKKRVTELIERAQKDLNRFFTFRYYFIGSTERNMVTYNPKSNIGFDLDVNIKVNEYGELSPKEIKKNFMNTFRNCAWIYGYNNCENSTRVLTLKVKDTQNYKIIHSCDIAIVRNYRGSQQYIRYDKKKNQYFWTEQSNGFYGIDDKVEFCKENKLWNDVRELYLEKKNFFGPEKKSRSIYAETIHEICQKNGYYNR